MKTKRQTKAKNQNQNQDLGLLSRPEQPITDNSPLVAALPPLDFEQRRKNRMLPTSAVIQLLRAEAPRFFEMAQVVGRWIWIQFADKQPREVTTVLAQLGFHWNNKRQAWQHPCGHLTKPSTSDPRAKYQSYHPADHQLA